MELEEGAEVDDAAAAAEVEKKDDDIFASRRVQTLCSQGEPLDRAN